MASKPAIGKKYARLRQEQDALLAAANQSSASSSTSTRRLELLAAAATANAWQITRPTFLEESTRPELQSEEWLQMESILQQAMELQQKHLATVRERAVLAEGDEYPAKDEEVNTQTSLEHIKTTLEAAKIAMVHAGHRAMLPAVAAQVLQFINTKDTFSFRTVSPSVCRACQDGDFLLMPCLDFVPEHRDDMPLFFTKVALGSTKVLWMNSVGTLQILETRFSLPALETFLLPKGMGVLFDALKVPTLPCLRQLFVRAGLDDESDFNWPKAVHSSKGALPDSLTLSGVKWIQELISKTPQRLSLIDMEDLDSRLALPFMKVVGQRTRPRRLILRRCVLPDVAIQYLCTALEERNGEAPFFVHFDSCELSVFSEEELGQALERFSFCAFSIDGGKVSETPIVVSDWCQAEPQFAAGRPGKVPNVNVSITGDISPTDSESNGSEEEEEDFHCEPVTAPPRVNLEMERSTVEVSTNPMTTAEMLDHVLQRLQQSYGESHWSQASAMDRMVASLGAATHQAASEDPEPTPTEGAEKTSV